LADRHHAREIDVVRGELTGIVEEHTASNAAAVSTLHTRIVK
jgi:hypothetical protein